MTGCSIKNIIIDKSFLDPTIPLLTLPHLLLVIPLKHDLYQFHHAYPELLLFVSEPHLLSLKHDNVNGDENSLKKNFRKNHSKALERTPSSSSGLALKIESMIQLSNRGVMLRFFPLLTLDTCLINLCIPSPRYMSHLTQYLHCFPFTFDTHFTYALLSP